ncbi:MAG: glycosyltransferase [bacterium]|nr:glycosyltransferase [bacterium]
MFGLKNKKILFITTKNTEYLRNVQEINLLSQDNSVTVVGYNDKSYIKRLLKVYFRLCFMSFKKFDLVFIGFAPQFILPLFNLRFRKKQITIDFFISVYDTLVFDRKIFKQNSIPAKLCKWLDKKCIHSAHTIICDTNSHGDYFATEFMVEREKINTLYLEADTSIYKKQLCKKPQHLSDKFVVLYFGSVLPLQGIDVVLKSAENVCAHKDIVFYFIGPLKPEQKTPAQNNFIHIDWLPQEKLAEHIGWADLCLAGHFNSQINKAKRTIPGKAYIYEAMEKPMILGENSATHELFHPDEKHFFVEMGNPEKLSEKILEIKNSVRN